jgi:hypothetical protein
MPRRAWTYTLVTVLLIGGFAIPARADFVVSIGSATIPQGGTGTIDIDLTSTASASSPDLLNNYAFTLQITGPHQLQFSTTQSFAYLSNGNYVFFGDSSNQMTASPGGTVTTTVYAHDTFIGTDSTGSGNPVSLTSGNTPVLLATLTLNAAITNVGDVYSVKLVPPSGNGSMESSIGTFFDNFNFDTGTETSAVPFTSSPGTVTISAGAAVPEPSTIVLYLTAALLLGGTLAARRCRRPEVGEA